MSGERGTTKIIGGSPNIYAAAQPGDWLLNLEFKLADCWVGVFWQRKADELHIWICLIPCFPIHLIRKGRRND